MALLQLIILFVNLATAVIGEYGNVNCPQFCKCDSYQRLNRAQCSFRNLISAELVLSNQVQILDLSYNDITTVDTKCFGSFWHLKYLNLSHNAVQSVEWDAFFNLQRLTEINLSYNRLEYLDERLFIKNKHLNKINLAGNKFQNLENKPLLRSPFVNVIILQDSQINLLQPQLFAGLSNLKHLDLSQNLLNDFNREDFQCLEKLHDLNLNDNVIQCSKEIINKLQQLENEGINVSLKECKSDGKAKPQQQNQMFEKLVMIDTTKQAEDQNGAHIISEWRVNIDFEEELNDHDDAENKFGNQEAQTNYKSNSEWLRVDPDTVVCAQNYALCQDYRSCLQQLSKAWHHQQLYSSGNDVKLAFVMGIAIGVATIVLILACALFLKRCLEVKNSAAVSVIDNANALPNQPLARPTSQLPPQVRRQPRRRPTRPARSLVRYEGPVAENFLSRLFGRPARHQYYRSINQNTATLIRRLSRSNLFNHRLSQHFTDRQNSAEVNSPAIQDCAATAPRPETPPPSYGDVIVKNINEGK